MVRSRLFYGLIMISDLCIGKQNFTSVKDMSLNIGKSLLVWVGQPKAAFFHKILQVWVWIDIYTFIHVIWRPNILFYINFSWYLKAVFLPTGSSCALKLRFTNVCVNTVFARFTAFLPSVRLVLRSAKKRHPQTYQTTFSAPVTQIKPLPVAIPSPLSPPCLCPCRTCGIM